MMDDGINVVLEVPNISLFKCETNSEDIYRMTWGKLVLVFAMSSSRLV